MNKWAYDIEVMGGNFFSATFINEKTDERKIFVIFDSINQTNQLEQFLNQEIILIGYNNVSYDGPVMQYLFQNKNSKTILQDLFDFSTKLVTAERGSYNYDFRKYQYPENVKYQQIDLMKIIEVNGNVPSLKLAGIILHWPKIQDLPYEFDKVVANIDECKTIIKYNENDVRITLELYRKILPQIELREKLSEMYNLNLISCSDSKIGDKIVEKYYSEKTGNKNFRDLKNNVIEYQQFILSDCIFPDIQFKTNFLKRIKKEIESTIVRKSNNYKMEKIINFGGVEYTIASGGLHSTDHPELLISNDEYMLIDCDFSSYYTSMMIKNNIVPEHIGHEFIEILADITKERIAAKKNGDKVKAFALKTSINSVYGKLGFPGSWFRDNRAVLKVTIPGQLYLMMLIERFVLSGIEVISANTDGIVCKVKRTMEDHYYQIVNSFSKEIGIEMEFTKYNLYARRDINNYVCRKYDGDIKYKGCYTPTPEIKKGYLYPIVPNAVYNQILNNISFEETIRNHKDILDFCISKKMDKKFQAEFHLLDAEVELLQKTNRFYISNEGGKLLKRNKANLEKTSGLFVNNMVTILNDYDKEIPFEDYDINYDFYLEEARKLLDGVVILDKPFEHYIDEDEDYSPPVDNEKRREFFAQFQNIKGLQTQFIDNLMWLIENFPKDNTNFCDYLKFATNGNRISSKILQMIKLNYFVKFGNQKKLIKFYEEFTSGPNKYTKTLSDKSKEKRILLLQEYWLWMKEEEFTILEQIQNEASVNTIPFSKYNVSNFYAYIAEINDKHSSRAKLKCYKLLTGDEREVEIYKNDMEYKRVQDSELKKLKVGDVILCKSLPKKFYKTKDENGKWVDTTKSYRLLESYYVMGINDKFFPPEKE